MEWVFYLAFPLFLLALRRVGADAQRVTTVLAGTAVGLYAVGLVVPPLQFYVLPVANLGVLVAGAALAMWHCATPLSDRTARPDPARAAMALMLLVVLVALPGHSLSWGWKAAVFPATAVCTMVLIHGCWAGNGVSWVLGHGALRHIGLRAYSLYLWHVPVMWIVWVNMPDSSAWVRAGVAAACIALIVVLSRGSRATRPRAGQGEARSPLPARGPAMSDDVTAPVRHRLSPATVAALVVAAAAVWFRWKDSLPWRLYDLRVYQAGGQAVLDGVDVYSVSAGGLRFTYPPFAAVLFSALAWLPDPLAIDAITCASLVGLVVMVVVARRWVPRPALAAIGLGALALEPVVRTLVLGQVNLVLMALVMLDLFVVPRRHRGWLVGLAAGIKLTPAIFVVVFALQRDWRACARAAAAFGATVVVSWFVAPLTGPYWSGGVDLADRFGDFAVTPANQSLTGVLMRGFGTAELPATLVVAVSLVTVVAVLAVAARQHHLGSDLGVVVSVSIGALLVSPVSWSHHWVWVVPALVLLVQQRWLLAAWASAALFFVSPIWLLSQEPGRSLSFGVLGLLSSGSYMLWAVVLLVTLALGANDAVGSRTAMLELSRPD